ncbi:MAG: D-alanyl-D-alanine carboxypeptidase [Ruminococcaceae bacterium]|nr:D-alanyl-D-alanine carboxypeptidase [Oscillospiraceae bacterium]
MTKRMISALTAFLFLCCVLGAQSVALATEREKTEIKGISSSITEMYDKTVKRTLTITPSTGGRAVSLDLYNSKSEKWNTVAQYTAPDAKSAEVTVTFPKKYRKRRTGKWRIVVAASKTAEKAVKKITFTSMNIVTKKVTAKTSCIYCVEDKKTIYGKSIHKRVKPASTTKIMTATLLLESGKYNKTTKISKKAATTPYGGVKMKKGDLYTYKSLLYCMLLPSSNAAAVATAEGLGGSVKGFAEMMNEKAKTIGLKDTHYVTPHGLDTDTHYSSAYDVSRTMAYIYPRSPMFRKAISRGKFSFTTVKYKEKKKVVTTNEILGSSPKHKGGKTGTTSGAGACFCSVYVHEGKTYVVTVMHSSGKKTRFDDTKKLYQYIDEYAATRY